MRGQPIELCSGVGTEFAWLVRRDHRHIKSSRSQHTRDYVAVATVISLSAGNEHTFTTDLSEHPGRDISHGATRDFHQYGGRRDRIDGRLVDRPHVECE